ncbi:MAG: methionine--tRNA ligase subunit beta, partial [Clostridia bacterium]|nr:methionine--tRNA ligase subunit beta [Clostridia bacterium]
LEKELEALAQAQKAPENPLKEEIEGVAKIAFDEFAKVDLRVMKVLACEPVPKADKLLKLTLDDGTGTPRTVVSGIAKWYQPADLTGHSVIVVTNLEPRMLRGVESRGMVLSAEVSKDEIKVLFADGIPAGSKLS